VKFATSSSSRLVQAAAAISVWIALLVGPVVADEPANIDPHDPEFEPGYRFAQAYSEDGFDLGSKGVELGWAAINRHGFELDLGTGVHVLKRYFDGQRFGRWSAFMALTAPWPVAPYAELGFDAGEALGEIVIDRAVKNTKGRDWIDVDAYLGLGLRISLTRRVQLKAYYKLHYVESEHYQALGSGVGGFALVLRFPRKHLEWWQIPL